MAGISTAPEGGNWVGDLSVAGAAAKFSRDKTILLHET
jgi:hypothetical protein